MYNNYFNIGKAARYGEKMMESLMGFSRVVINDGHGVKTCRIRM
jgi:hypothetical protein